MTDLHAKETTLWLIVCTTWVILPYAFYLPIWALIPFVIMAGWRYMIHSHGWRSPNRAVRLVLSFLAMLLIYQHYHTFFGRDAGLTFLLLLMGLKFSELEQQRDRILLVYILFLLILGNFLFDQTLWVAGYLVVSVVACLAALIQIQQPTGMTVTSRMFVSGKLVLAAIPLMLIMYFLFPRLPFGLWGFNNSQTTSSGFSEELRPGKFSRLVESTEPVFRVQFENNQAPPPAAQQYWRGAVLNDTDGRRWYDDKTKQDQQEQIKQGKQLFNYTITMEPTGQAWLFPLDLPANKPGRYTFRQDLTLKTTRKISERRRYRLQSYLQYQTTLPKNLARFLALPVQTSERVKKLAGTWREKTLSSKGEHNTNIVNQAMVHFRNELFYYTLEPPLLGGDPVDEFLFETKKGYCEHYASAFVTLMRAAGVPARVVVGFQGSEYNTAGNYLTVRRSDAHAWAEYLHPNHGWVRVDPTAAVAPSRIEYGIDSLRDLASKGLDLGLLPNPALKNSLAADWLRGITTGVRLRWDAINFAWYRWVEDFGPQRQKAILKALGLINTNWMLRLAVMTAIVIVLLAVFVAFFFRKEKTHDKTLRHYLQFCEKLSRHGFIRRTTEGPRAFAERVIAARPEWSTAIGNVTNYYVALRYDKPKMNLSLKNLRQAIQQFKPA